MTPHKFFLNGAACVLAQKKNAGGMRLLRSETDVQSN